MVPAYPEGRLMPDMMPDKPNYKYLDPKLSVIVSSPAGSGKTEKLARRYISLIKQGAPIERVLCITYTEKAAAEMKERILSIVKREDPVFYKEITASSPLMRISTFHAFCFRVLKRFSFELGLDPSLSISDDHTSRTLWSLAVEDAFRESPGMFHETLVERGLKGWSALRSLLDKVYDLRPYPELLIKKGVTVHESSADLSLKVIELFTLCGA